MRKTFTFKQIISTIMVLAAVAFGQNVWAQTFTIEASYNSSTHTTTFTITRSGSSLPAQTIKYRTVNLSAYAGQHYTAVSNDYTFPEGITTKTVEVTESAAGTDAYKYQNGTSRSYRFEVLDVNGFQLDYYDRNMTTGTQFSNAKVSKSVSNLVTFSGSSFSSGMSSSKYLDVSFTPPSGWVEANDDNGLQGYVLIDDSYDYANKPAVVSTSSLINSTGATASYLESLGYKIYATVCFTEKERDDGYQYVQIVAGSVTHSYDGADGNGVINNGPTNSVYKVCYELADGSNATGKAYFPHRGTGTDEFSLSTGKLWQQKYKSNSYGTGTGSVILDPTISYITTRFDAGGDNDDTWGYKDFFVRMALCDATYPNLLNNSTAGITVSAGPYVKGNTFYISVPFTEIVHISGAYKKLNTTWGDVEYVAGDYTNVITYKGTINASAGTTLAITGIENSLFNDLSLNYYQGSNSSFNKTFTGVTCTATYTLAATNTSFSGLANEYVVNTTAIEPHPTVYFYKGIVNVENRVQLTETTNYTLAWANNTTAGNGTVTATGTGSYTGSVSTTFPIRWSTYTFRFHGNGSVVFPVTGTMSDQVFEYGVAQNLTANAFSREGFNFAGWNTQPGGNGDSYSNSQEILGLTTKDGAIIDLYAQWTTIPWTGSGDSEEDPYVIMYPSQLDLLASNVSGGNTYEGKYFKLGDDITYNYEGLGANESNYTPIGTGGYAFHGTFDGNNKTISGIRIYTTYTTGDYKGVFKFVGSNGTVKNVVLANSIFKAKVYVGGIASRNAGILTNCRVEGTVEILPIDGLSLYHGGIAGENSGTVSGCISAAVVVKNGMPNVHYYGGIVGENTSTGTVKDCLYTGSTVDAHNYYGAIAGINEGILTNNYYTTEGIWGVGVGQTNPSGNDCDGARRARVITLDENIVLVGGQTEYSLSGLTAIGTTALSYNDGTTTTLYSGATQNVKLRYNGVLALGYGCTGFTATNNATVNGNTLTMPDNNVTVSAIVSDVWGIADGADGTEAHPYVITNTTGLDLLAKNVNGIDGYTSNSFNGKHFKLDADITYSYEGLGANESNYTAIGLNKYFCGNFDGNNKTISGIRIRTDKRYQGIFGEVSHGTVKNVILANSIIVGAQSVGGIIGETNHCTVTNCRVENDVTIRLFENGVSYHGGIVGQQSYGTISGCVSAATLTDGIGSNFGGIAGNTYQGTIKDCIFIGTIHNGGSRGSIVGTNNGGTLTNNYYTSSIGGVNQSDCNGARRARVITLEENIALAGNQTVYSLSGLTAIGNKALSYNNGTTTTIYSGATQNVALSYTGTINTGYNLAYSYDDGSIHAISGNSFEMPASDVTVSATFTDVWGISDGADGSEEHPYIITTTTGLNLLAKNVNGTDSYTANDFYKKHFKLGNDITYSYTTNWDNATSNENNYTSIGNLNNVFHGSLDGCGYTVRGIRIYNTLNDDIGLIGYLGIGTIKNLTLSDTRITGRIRTGGIAGRNYSGTLQNCHVTGTVNIHGSYCDNHGGIAGLNSYEGIITDCTCSASITYGGSDHNGYGGIVGYNYGEINNCLVLEASIPEVSQYVGAIVGHNRNYLSQNYYYNCTVAGTANASNVGVGSENGGSSASSDQDGARQVYTIILGDDIIATATAVASFNDVLYYTSGTEVTLSYTGTVPDEERALFLVNGNYITGNTFVMADEDATVTVEVLARYTYDSTTGALSLNWGEFNSENKWGDDVVTSEVTSVTATGNVSFTGSCFKLFGLMKNCTSIDLHDVNTDNMTSCQDMFANCIHLTTLNVAGWNTANVTTMEQMFLSCLELTTITGISYWNTSKVVDMTCMFACCSSLSTLDLSGWDTSKTTNLKGLFTDCVALFSLNISGWNTSAVQDMSYLFSQCHQLTTLDLSGWNTSEVRKMVCMFYYCYDLTTIYVSTLWNTDKVYIDDSEGMFYACQSLKGGMDTPYEWMNSDARYAHIDGGYTDPGYLTAAPNTVALSKDIVGYGADNNVKTGWYLIASPLAGKTWVTYVNNLTSNTYDLYRFNQSADAEWENYKAHQDDNENPFHALENGQGYLYANSDDVTLNFVGAPYSGDGTVTLTKTDDVDFEGWNLVGNPWGEVATADKDFYCMNAEGSEIIPAAGSTVNAMEGIFVHADADSDVVTFTPSSKNVKGNRDDDASLVINLSKGNNGTIIDRAIVRFDSNRTMTKLQIFDGNTKLYIPQDGKNYAIVGSERQGEMPLNFKAKEMGKYTISVETCRGASVPNVKLIDRFEDVVIDFTETSSYTFIGSPSDSQSRFIIQFEGSELFDSSENSIFAYQNGTDLIVTGEGELQIFDVMGRMVMTQHVNGVQTCHGASLQTGIYILKLNEKTQKIVIK